MSELFNGRWELDTAHALVWDVEQGKYLPDEVGSEIITISVKDGVQDYEVLYGDNPTARMGYTATYDSPEWVPYVVREIIGVSAEDEEAAVEQFRRRIRADSGSGQRQIRVGQNYGLVRLVLIDDRTHYRISKQPDGSPQAALLRRLSEDGSSYMTSLLDPNGVVYRIRPFLRTA
jgi:hypothetical protein